MMWDCKVRWAGLIVGIVASTAACKRSEAVPDEPVEVVQEQETANSDAEEAGDAGDETDTSKAGDEVEPEDESAKADGDDAQGAEEPAPKGYSWARETIGPLRIGLSPAEVLAALGEPSDKGEPEEEPASGDVKAFWSYMDKDVSMVFVHESEDPSSPAWLEKFSVWGASPYKTSRGIGIGSSFSSVVKAYKNVNDPDQDSYPDSIVHNDELIIVGSTFGGLAFAFENKRVTDISIGGDGE